VIREIGDEAQRRAVAHPPMRGEQAVVGRLGVTEARALQPRHDLLVTEREQVLHQRKALVLLRRAAGPVEHGRSQRCGIEWVGHFVAVFFVRPGICLLAPLAHRIGESTLEVAEKREGDRRAPFLALKQHRHHRGEQGNRERGLDLFWRCQAFQPLAKRTITDLIVVLQEVDEGRRRQLAARLAARLLAPEFRDLALIDEAGGERARKIHARRLVIAVIAGMLAGQHHVPDVMIIVVPLATIFAVRRVLRSIEQAGAIVAVLQHEVDVASRGLGELAGGNAEVLQHGLLARDSHDVVGGVEPEAVEAVVAEPGQRVLDGKRAHLRQAVVDRAAPWRVRIGEEGRRIAAEIIPLRAEMIVDHVEEHHQPAQMGLVDQRLQVFGPAIGAVGRIPQHAVIAPAAASCEICQRHQFQRGDAGCREMIELVDHGAVGAFGREDADMGLDQHRLFPRTAPPFARAPYEGVVIDHLARAEHVLGLESRSRIRHVDLIVDPELVGAAGGEAGNVGDVPAILPALHRVPAVEQEVDTARGGRP